MLSEAGVTAPLFISGATTSALHTAVKIAPYYLGNVFHIKDASQNPVVALQLATAEADSVIEKNRSEQASLREEFLSKQEQSSEKLPRLMLDWSSEIVNHDDMHIIWQADDVTVADVRRYINWRTFHHFWSTSPHTKEGRALRAEAERILDKFSGQKIRGRVVAVDAYSTGDSIVATGFDGQITIPTPRQKSVNVDGVALSLADFVAPEGYNDQICLFAATVPKRLVTAIERYKASEDDYNALLYQSLADRVVEASSEYMHRQARYHWLHIWDENPGEAVAAEKRLTIPQLFAAKYRGIRPAVGYSCLPEQRIIFDIDRLLHLEELGIMLTESGAMYPQSSVCGLYIGSKSAKYFIIA